MFAFDAVRSGQLCPVGRPSAVSRCARAIREPTPLPLEHCRSTLGYAYSTCEDPTIRVDGVQHWINGAATFLEYLRQMR